MTTPEEKLAQQHAREAISQRYLGDNPDLDPSHQDQLDKNRIPGEFGVDQLSPNSETKTRLAAQHDSVGTAAQGGASTAQPAPADVTSQVRAVGSNLSRAVDTSLTEQPYTTLALAGLIGFALGALWKD